jgi:hypothetical protein
MNITLTVDSATARYLLQLVYTDINRMRSHSEHAASHGERHYAAPVENYLAEELEKQILASMGEWSARHADLATILSAEGFGEEDEKAFRTLWNLLQQSNEAANMAREAIAEVVAELTKRDG